MLLAAAAALACSNKKTDGSLAADWRYDAGGERVHRSCFCSSSRSSRKESNWVGPLDNFEGLEGKLGALLTLLRHSAHVQRCVLLLLRVLLSKLRGRSAAQSNFVHQVVLMRFVSIGRLGCIYMGDVKYLHLHLCNQISDSKEKLGNQLRWTFIRDPFRLVAIKQS